jgi:hypothetical protein
VELTDEEKMLGNPTLFATINDSFIRKTPNVIFSYEARPVQQLEASTVRVFYEVWYIEMNGNNEI